MLKYSGFGLWTKSKGSQQSTRSEISKATKKAARGWQKGAFFGTPAALSHRSVAATPLPPQPLGELMAPRQP